MPNDIFSYSQQDASRMEWMKRHHIVTAYNFCYDYWYAQVCENGVWGQAATHIEEEGALHNLAIKLGIPFWNEE